MVMLRPGVALLSGLIFGGGLVLSGMADPAKVTAFLDLAAMPAGGGAPSLALVMAGALAIALPGFALARRRDKPLFAAGFRWPSARDLDGRLIIGSVIFGIGWGLAGICPGPALTLLVFSPASALVFILAMLAGMLIRKITEAK
jgi:uncharacterized membrane protein YedE/YeeE